MKRTKKKVTFKDVVLFIAVYMGIGMGGKLFISCVVYGNALDRDTILNAFATGLGLMVARQIVWAFEYFTRGHIV